MNVGDERSKSCWMDSAPTIAASPLDGDRSCDVVVIGAGIAGLSTAYELSRFGRAVIVIDRGAIGRGMTARTTAHLATELDDFYSELIRTRGEEEARLYYDSQVAAVNRIEAICRDEGIDADFARIDGFLFPALLEDRAALEEEYRACRKISVNVEWADRAPVPGIDTGKALRFPDQARFHPTKYLAGLARAILARGGRIYSDTAYLTHAEAKAGVEITTDRGVVRAGAAVFATNSPVNNRVTIHTKQLPHRTYAIAGRVPKGSVPDALVWDTLDAYHYVRIQPLNDSEDLLIVGGEDHQSGQASDMERRLASLELWTRERYPGFGSAEYRWSGQVMEPIDFMPFSGRNPGSRNIYVHTGDSGEGITNGGGRQPDDPAADRRRGQPVCAGARSRPEIVHQRLVARRSSCTARSRRSKIWPSISVRPRSARSTRSRRAKGPSCGPARPRWPAIRARTASSSGARRPARMSGAWFTGTRSRNAGTAPATARSSHPTDKS